MAKDRELADHERAHTGQPGSKVDHGDWVDHPEEREELHRNAVHDYKAMNPDYGYRRISALSKAEGKGMSTRQTRKHLKTYEPPR